MATSRGKAKRATKTTQATQPTKKPAGAKKPPTSVAAKPAAAKAKPAAAKAKPTAAKTKPAAAKTKLAAAITAPRPTAAGYSGTPLPQKLGIKEGHHVVLLHAPAAFAAALAPLPPVHLSTALSARGSSDEDVDVLLFFCRARRELESSIARLHAALTPAGGLWIAWPKKSSKLPTDMTEDVVRAVALPRGLVDNKVCAIDETWSGLRLVIRKELRAKTK